MFLLSIKILAEQKCSYLNIMFLLSMHFLLRINGPVE
jgi:hypothetical protein